MADTVRRKRRDGRCSAKEPETIFATCAARYRPAQRSGAIAVLDWKKRWARSVRSFFATSLSGLAASMNSCSVGTTSRDSHRLHRHMGQPSRAVCEAVEYVEV